METAIFNLKGEEIGKYDLPEVFFGEKPDRHFLHEVVSAYLSNRRAGTSSTKTRTEVSGGGRKPWKQKGTGRARAGSIRSPLWRKGGIVFGPKPRSYRKGMPASKRRQALAQALSAKFSEGNVTVIDSLAIAEPKTRILTGILRSLKADGRVLVVSESMNGNLQRAGRNVPGFAQCLPADLNAYTVLWHNKAIFTKAAMDALSSLWKEDSVHE